MKSAKDGTEITKKKSPSTPEIDAENHPSLTLENLLPNHVAQMTSQNFLKSVALQLYANMKEVTAHDVSPENVRAAIEVAREIREYLEMNHRMIRNLKYDEKNKGT